VYADSLKEKEADSEFSCTVSAERRMIFYADVTSSLGHVTYYHVQQKVAVSESDVQTEIFSILSKNESRFIKSPVCLSVCPPIITFELLSKSSRFLVGG
jgi:uncharacterized membrane protein YjjB (DUF3815 family)